MSYRKPEITTSWDDFTEEDMKLGGLLLEYEIPAVFYIPYNRLLDDNALKVAKMFAKHFEIGSHTINHPILTDLGKEQLREEIIESKKMLEEALGVEVRRFCYPRGRFNERIIDIVKEAGYIEGRTTEVMSTEMSGNPYKRRTSVHIYPRPQYEGVSWHEVARGLLDKAIVNGGYFHLWGHAWEITKLNEWENLETFFRYMNIEMEKI